ncbi:hypothetical protein [Amycolatopsis sp. NPDC051371]|uniref:hypothetical protein n=1 Tax=Amycolatopsis sp. NPDC051371 TaxID=3155800 RepID=UPI00342B5EEB
MTQLQNIYLATLTRSATNSGTNSKITLVVNQRGVDRLNHTFGDTVQADQEKGQANLYQLDVRNKGIDSERLTEGSVRVGTLGDDEWRPEILFLWGTGPVSSNAPGLPPPVVPLAIETSITTRLSTNDSNAVPSMTVRPIRTRSNMFINRLLFIVTTAWEPGRWETGISDPGPSGKGTNDRVEIEIFAEGSLAVKHVISDTPQDDLEPGQVNMYDIPVAVPFRRSSMGTNSVRLSITGTDLWLPLRVYLFGMDALEGHPGAIVPLVHIDNWGIVPLSTDTEEGNPRVVLPLVPRTQDST